MEEKEATADYGRFINPHDRPDALGRLSELVDILDAQEEYVANLQASLDKATARRDELAQVLIPEAMAEAGQFESVDVGGRRVTLNKTYHGNIAKEQRAAAHAWLRANGFGSIIKNDVTVRFGKGEDADANQLAGILSQEYAAKLRRNESVHHSTLNAFVKERLTKGDELPDSLGAHVRTVAKITRKG